MGVFQGIWGHFSSILVYYWVSTEVLQGCVGCYKVSVEVYRGIVQYSRDPLRTFKLTFKKGN